jgi:hypothetical protein
MASKLKFGKHYGRTVDQVLECGDYQYIVWLWEKCTFKPSKIGLTQEMYNRAKQMIVVPEKKEIDYLFLEQYVYDRIHGQETMTIQEACQRANCSEGMYANMHNKIFHKLHIMQKEKKNKEQEIDIVDEFPMITVVGRKEVINGKVCHVYPSRMNF